MRNDRKRSSKEKRAIRRYYAQKAEKEKAKQHTAQRRVEAPYPHFRYYKKSRHPALIVGEQQSTNGVDEYRYRKVMHGEKDGKRNNETIYPNPDPSDPDPMHIGKRVRHDDKDNFEPKPLPWKYPKKGKKK